MDYSLLVGIHNCDDEDHRQQPQPLDLGDSQMMMTNSSDEHDSSGSAATPPDSPMLMQPDSTVSFTADLDTCLEFFAIKSAERELLLLMSLLSW